MTSHVCWLSFSLAWFPVAGVRAERIYWSSTPAAVNETSTLMPMTGSFNFELGVFNNNFVPNASNKAQWAANWHPAQRVAYRETDRQFAGLCTVTDNLAPFTQGTAAYIWGFQGGVTASEWILIRKSSPTAWAWPAPDPMNPNLLYWNASTATAVIGTLNTLDAQNNPVLMTSAAVNDAASPPTTWLQWQTAELTGVPLNNPNDDPDHDGVSNMMEFVFGTPPKQAGTPPATPVEKVTVSEQQYLQITIPRRIDHVASLTVQVSPDLTHWDSGPGFTVTVSNNPAALVVRDLTALGAAVPQRFMRLKAELTTP